MHPRTVPTSRLIGCRAAAPTAGRILAGVPRSMPTELGFRPATRRSSPTPTPCSARCARRAGRWTIPERDSWLLPRFADVHAALRHRGLGRIFTHRYSAAEFGRDRSGRRLSALAGVRALVAAQPGAAGPHPDPPAGHRGVHAAVGRPAAAGGRADQRRAAGRAARPADRFDLIGDYAQPYSIAVICALLGVPLDRSRQLLDWSHAIVKMYELSNTRDRAAARREPAAA